MLLKILINRKKDLQIKRSKLLVKNKNNKVNWYRVSQYNDQIEELEELIKKTKRELNQLGKNLSRKIINQIPDKYKERIELTIINYFNRMK